MRRKTLLLFVASISLGFFSCDPMGVDVSQQNVLNKSSMGPVPVLDQNRLAAPNAQLVKLGEGYGFTEGPAVDKHGNVFFTDQPNNKIVKWATNNGALSTFLANSGRSNGTYFDKDGKLIACADMNGEIWSIDKNGNHTVLVDNYNGKLLNGPNDLWINPISGGMYITDPLYVRGYWDASDPRRVESQQGGAHLYYLSPDRSTFIRVDEDLIVPNGIVGSPDGKKLYVGHIVPEATYVYDINSDGSLSNRQLFCSMRTDGMTTDEKGNVYLTNEQGVTAFDKNGQKIFNIPTGEGWTANVVFGGENGKTLFITALGRVYGVKMNVKGVVK
jgi:gluconolactonase